MEQKGGELGEEMDFKNRTMLEEESSGWWSKQSIMWF